MIRYFDNMTNEQQDALLKQERALDQAYGDYYGSRHWLQEIADLILLQVEWEKQGLEFMAPREEWDQEQYRRYFVDDLMVDELHELRRAALDHNGRP